MNVIGSRPDGWWRDRDAAVRRLAGDLAALAGDQATTITVVFDGHPVPDLGEGTHHGVDVRYARRPGRDGADDRIVADLASEPRPSDLVVVTSDRRLAQRAEAAGAAVRGASWLRARLDAVSSKRSTAGPAGDLV